MIWLTGKNSYTEGKLSKKEHAQSRSRKARKGPTNDLVGETGFPNPAGKFGMMGQSILFGTRIAVGNPILDPYKRRNTSVPASSTRARLACPGALLGWDLEYMPTLKVQSSTWKLPVEGALWAGVGCVEPLLMSHLWA